MRLSDLGLPDYLYKVRVPTVATYSEDEIDSFGMPVSIINGKKEEDYEADATVMLPLDKIIDIYISGYSISLLDDNVSKMYNALEEYVSKLGVRQESINMMPLRDSRADDIEQFLTEMFNYNKTDIVTDNLGANSGFNLGINVMHRNGVGMGTATNRERVIVNSGIGIMQHHDVGYKDTPIAEEQAVSYITSSDAVIDMSKVKRVAKPRQRRGARYEPKDV